MLKNILGKFVKPSIIKECLKDGGLEALDFHDIQNHVDSSSLMIGFQTKQTLSQLLREGDISPHQQALFYKAIKAFFVRATEYLLKWCPFQEELLTHSTWLHFEDRLEKNFLSVEYFVLKYPDILHDVNIDLLNEQFLNY